jgi:putative (di)nucleoside polyphosphate hydrolase
MPQGGIDRGEAPLQAAWRELEEEVGTAHATLLAETSCWYAYDLPEAIVRRSWRGRYRGQAQKWFLFRFEGTDDEIDLDAHQPEFSAWRWAPVSEVIATAWEVKREIYRAVLTEFAGHLDRAFSPQPPQARR